MSTSRTTLIATLLIILGLLLSACGGGDDGTIPTLNVGVIQTLAVATFSSGLTQTALFAPPSAAPTTTTPLPTFPSPTLVNVTPFATGSGLNPITACNRLSYVADVSIPDNAPMTPGQTFTKTWKVRNTGSCAWDAGFKFAFVSGDAMSGATYTLAQSVPANTQIDISIEMIAPNKTGAVRGNWRMSTTAGAFFGDELYVLIMIGGTTGTVATSGITSTPTSTGTPTPTQTHTPVP